MIPGFPFDNVAIFGDIMSGEAIVLTGMMLGVRTSSGVEWYRIR
jgi:hypothetical protein